MWHEINSRKATGLGLLVLILVFLLVLNVRLNLGLILVLGPGHDINRREAAGLGFLAVVSVLLLAPILALILMQKPRHEINAAGLGLLVLVLVLLLLLLLVLIPGLVEGPILVLKPGLMLVLILGPILMLKPMPPEPRRKHPLLAIRAFSMREGLVHSAMGRFGEADFAQRTSLLHLELGALGLMLARRMARRNVAFVAESTLCVRGILVALVVVGIHEPQVAQFAVGGPLLCLGDGLLGPAWHGGGFWWYQCGRKGNVREGEMCLQTRRNMLRLSAQAILATTSFLIDQVLSISKYSCISFGCESTMAANITTLLGPV